MENALPSGNQPLVLFNDPRPIETMFDTSAIAYDREPTDDDLDRVRRAGYTAVILYDDTTTRPAAPDNTRRLAVPSALFEK